MAINWENQEILQDLYLLNKSELGTLLENFGITTDPSDIVADLRPVAAALKNFVKKHKNTPTAREAFEKLVVLKTRLEENTLQIYPDLLKIQEFLNKKENIYDQVPNNTYENNYEQLNIVSNQVKTQEVKLPNMAENLPLISAGTFHGLQSENPNEFVEKYEIAALSNNWQDGTKIKLFPAHLAGNALAWFAHYSKDKNLNNWGDLKNKFIETFRPMAQANNLQMILEKKVQKPDQQSLNYFLEILAICKRYDQGITEKQIIQYVIQGLRPEICERILGENTSTLEELENSLRKVELRLNIQHQNKEKYNRVINEDKSQVRESSRERYYNNSRQNTRDDEIRALQTEIKTLTNIVSNLNIGGGNYAEKGHKEDHRWNNRRTGSTERRYQEEQRNYRGSSREGDRRGQRWGQEERQYSGQRSYGGVPRSQIQQQSRGRSPERRVHFERRDSRGANQPPQPAPGGNKFCRICKRTNHYTDQCRYKNSGPGRGYRSKFCNFCKMNNHNTGECFKLRKEGGSQNQKN